MSTEPDRTSNEHSFVEKARRRRELAALPIEQKLRILIELQQLSSEVARSAGRDHHKPWEIDLPADIE